MDSILAYIGGKSRLSKTIIERFPEHENYCEVFGGGLWVFFRKGRSKFEVVNDLDSELTNLYRQVQNHKDAFLKECEYLICSRQEFERLNSIPAEHLTEIQRAARYFYIQRLGYGGRVRDRTYGGSSNRKPRVNWDKLEERIIAAHHRLRQATIENLAWPEMISRYDRANTFFYLDPPYFKRPYYRYNMELADFEELAAQLAGIRGRFILSINDEPEMREVFGKFNLEPVSLQYSVAAKNRTEASELLVKNF